MPHDPSRKAALFLDAVGFLLADQRRAGRLRRACKRLGLSPSPLHKPTLRGFTVSLGPAWEHPDDLANLLAFAAGLSARVTRLDIALDLIGLPARRARWRFFSSLDDPHADASGDAIQLDGRSPRVPYGRTSGSWIKHDEGGAAYARPRRSRRNLVTYSDRPSKLDPDGPGVLHVELRLRPPLIPTDPTEVVALLDVRELARLLAQHVELLHPVRALLPRPLARAYVRARTRGGYPPPWNSSSSLCS